MLGPRTLTDLTSSDGKRGALPSLKKKADPTRYGDWERDGRCIDFFTVIRALYLMSARPRPLSPHLQVYRWQMTSVLSILHRGTGLLLVLGTAIIAFWVIALALGQNIFSGYQAWLSSPLGKTLLVGWSFSLFYHLANGIRHLLWDVGWLSLIHI